MTNNNNNNRGYYNNDYDDDAVTIATTSDCSHEEAPPAASGPAAVLRRRRRRCCRRDQMKILCRMPSFWFFIISCILLLISIIALPIVKTHFERKRKYVPPKGPMDNNDNNNGAGSNNNNNDGTTTTPGRPSPTLLRKPTMAPTPSPTIDVTSYLLQHNLIKDETVLSNVESPEYKASQFMLASRPSTMMGQDNNNNNKVFDPRKFQERFALAVLYHALGGDHWNYAPVKYNFLSPIHSICDWNAIMTDYTTNRTQMYGIICNGNGWVSRIVLYDNNLVGYLSNVLFDLLPDLEVIYLSYNRGLVGSLPSTLSKLNQLKVLFLSDASLTGTLFLDDKDDTTMNIEESSSSSVFPPSLRILYLARNHFQGSLPPLLPVSLEMLSLEENYLTGSLDALERIGNNLQDVYLEDNFFDHSMDTLFLSNHVHSLRFLDLSDNPGIRGDVPVHLFLEEGSQLEVLDLHDTGIERIPSFSSMPQQMITTTTTTINSNSPSSSSTLQFLALHQTPFLQEGNLPTFGLDQLTHLDLTSSGLTGVDMKKMLFGSMEEQPKMTNLQYLFLAHTNFTSGPIPKEMFTKLTNLKDLSLKDSHRTGSIPLTGSSSSSLTNLVLMDLEGNDLTGSIPSSLFTSLPNIEYMLLNRNRLNGMIPTSLKQANHLKMLLLNDNLLTGDVPNDDIIESLNRLEYFYLQGNPFLTGNLTSSCGVTSTMKKDNWKTDCELVTCHCCSSNTCNDNNNSSSTAMNEQEEDIFLLQYDSPRWYHSYERPNADDYLE